MANLRFVRPLLGWSLGAAVACSSANAHATGGDLLVDLVKVTEVLIPDVHLEVRENGFVPLVLAWPMHVGLGFGALGHSRYVVLTSFLEPALVPADGNARLALGSRAGFRLGGDDDDASLGVLLEAGGLLATDGHGGFVGAGIGGLVVHDRVVFVAPSYRFVITSAGLRHDVSVDLLTAAF